MIPGVHLTANSKIFITLQTPLSEIITAPEIGTPTVPSGSRNIGAGTFTVQSINPADLTIVVADTSFFDWMIVG